MQVDIIGADEMAAAFAKAPSETNAILKDVVGKTAFLVERKAKGYTPIRFGALRGSIHTEGPYLTTNNVEAKVGTNLNYAIHQEYGTGIYGKNHAAIRPKTKKMLAWRQNGKWVFARKVRGTPGKFYMKKAREEGMSFLDPALRDASNKIFEILTK